MKLTLKDGTEFNIVRYSRQERADGEGTRKKRGWITFDADQDMDAVRTAFTADNLSDITFSNGADTHKDSYSRLADITLNMSDEDLEQAASVE